MYQGFDPGPKSKTTSVAFSSNVFSFLCLCVRAFTLRMFALKACCQKAGGSEAKALCGWEVR